MFYGFNVPIMSYEGIEKTCDYITNEIKETGKISPFGKYFINNFNLSYERQPQNSSVPMKRTLDDYRIDIVFSLIKAMREDVCRYGIDKYIQLIKNQQFNSKGYPDGDSIYSLLTKENILKTINSSISVMDIKRCLSNNNLSSLPIIVQYLYTHNKIKDEHIGVPWEVPYVIKDYDLIHERETKLISEWKKTTSGMIGHYSNYFRVYINTTSDENAYIFYSLFVNELIKKRIPYNNKYNKNSVNDKDKSIFYFPFEHLQDVIDTLDGIQLTYPNIVSNFGTPVSSCLQKTYYGICHNGDSNGTYNRYVSHLMYSAYIITMCYAINYNMRFFSELSLEERKLVLKYKNWQLNENILNDIRDRKGLGNLATSSDIAEFIKKYSIKISNLSSINDISFRNRFNDVVCLLHSYAKFGDFNHGVLPIAVDQGIYDIASLENCSGFNL